MPQGVQRRRGCANDSQQWEAIKAASSSRTNETVMCAYERSLIERKLIINIFKRLKKFLWRYCNRLQHYKRSECSLSSFKSEENSNLNDTP